MSLYTIYKVPVYRNIQGSRDTYYAYREDTHPTQFLVVAESPEAAREHILNMTLRRSPANWTRCGQAVPAPHAQLWHVAPENRLDQLQETSIPPSKS